MWKPLLGGFVCHRQWHFIWHLSLPSWASFTAASATFCVVKTCSSWDLEAQTCNCICPRGIFTALRRSGSAWKSLLRHESAKSTIQCLSWANTQELGGVGTEAALHIPCSSCTWWDARGVHRKRLPSVIKRAHKRRLAELSAFQEGRRQPRSSHLLKKSCTLSWSYWPREQEKQGRRSGGGNRWGQLRKVGELNPWWKGATAERENGARYLSCYPSPLQSWISRKRLRGCTGSWENKGEVTSAATAQSQQPGIVWQM